MVAKLLDPKYAIYALSTDGEHYRYVGFTARGVRHRMSMHRWEAKHGNGSPLYDWMREVGPDNVIVTVLGKLPFESTQEDLGASESYWIERLRGEGHELLNRSSGGLGAPGIVLTGAQRMSRSERARLQMAEHNHLQTPEIQAKATAARTGRKRGSYNWADVSKQAESGGRAAHNRWHVARGIVNNDCTHCVLGR